MDAFIIAFVHRVMSGMHSFFGYSKKIEGLWAVGVSMMIYPWLVAKPHWLFVLYFLINILIVLMKTTSFDQEVMKFMRKYRDIHLWEELLTSGFVIWLTLAGYNIIMICCSVYPALILHKGLINLGNRLKFFDSRTDDPTGKTYGIPLLGIKVPRSGTKFRLIMAGLSIVTATVTWSMGWSPSLKIIAF